MSGAPKYSVIIPAYNAEKTLDRCLRSLTDQKRQDVEIIVVDDGSTDGTARILQKFSEENRSVIPISQENRGVSHARNAGLARATGWYLTFADSDDFVRDTYFQELDQMDPQADLCYFQTETIGGRQAPEAKLFDRVNESPQWTDKMALLLSSREIMHPVNKRLKRQIIQEHRLSFPEDLQVSEDFNFCLAYSLCCDTIKAYQSRIYCVDLSNAYSLSRKPRPDLTADILRGFGYAAAALETCRREEPVKNRLLAELDYLYAKNVFTCVSETFKFHAPSYRKNREAYQKICRAFQKPLGSGTHFRGIVHHGLRILLKYPCVFPFYLVSRLAKGRQYQRYRVEKP